MQTLTPAALAAALAVPDLTDPDLADAASGPTAMQTLIRDVSRALAGAWSAEVRDVRGPRIVSVADNYEHLGYAAAALTRDSRYSRYLSAHQMLRSHTSAAIPAALRSLAGETSPAENLLLVAPGLCYRRDSIDRLHTGAPHQLDLWRIRRTATVVDDLADMVALVAHTLLPGRSWRLIPAEHPYTVAGQQIDVRDDDTWVEVGECGLASPRVLAASGLPLPWSGLAMGLGLDRVLMLRKGVPDIRLLRSTDPRVREQMLDLAPYRPVSSQPAITRDLSVALASSHRPPSGAEEEGWAEVVGDRIRDALGPQADLLESVAVLSETAYADLPAAARARLGIAPDQVNLLVRLRLRALDRTLTDADANEIRDRIYAALHEGAPEVVAART